MKFSSNFFLNEEGTSVALPEDIIRYIFSFLKIEDLQQALRVSKDWRKIVESLPIIAAIKKVIPVYKLLQELDSLNGVLNRGTSLLGFKKSAPPPPYDLTAIFDMLVPLNSSAAEDKKQTIDAIEGLLQTLTRGELSQSDADQFLKNIQSKGLQGMLQPLLKISIPNMLKKHEKFSNFTEYNRQNKERMIGLIVAVLTQEMLRYFVNFLNPSKQNSASTASNTQSLIRNYNKEIKKLSKIKNRRCSYPVLCGVIAIVLAVASVLTGVILFFSNIKMSHLESILLIVSLVVVGCFLCGCALTCLTIFSSVPESSYETLHDIDEKKQKLHTLSIKFVEEFFQISATQEIMEKPRALSDTVIEINSQQDDQGKEEAPILGKGEENPRNYNTFTN